MPAIGLTQATKLGCVVKRAAALGTTAAGFSIPWDTEIFDNGGFFTSAADTKLTIPEAGFYVITAQISSGNNNSISYAARIRLNGTKTLSEVYLPAMVWPSQPLVAGWYFAKSDYVEFRLSHSGSNYTIPAEDANQCYLSASIFKVV
jgi:hypothetical protein